MVHCGRHDKIYDENNPCPGCETEKQANALAEQRDTPPKKNGKKTATEE